MMVTWVIGILAVGLSLALIHAQYKLGRIIQHEKKSIYGNSVNGAMLKMSSIWYIIPLLFTLIGLVYPYFKEKNAKKEAYLLHKKEIQAQYDTAAIWESPELVEILDEPQGDLIRYGRELIINTSDYFGPNGAIKPLSNGMNCQNCHLDAGTKAFGNNYSAVLATYPKLRARSGTYENITKRVSDCFQRSLNGDAPDSTSKEMKSMIAYIEWLGQAVPKKINPKGAGLPKLKYMDRACDPEKGRLVFINKCQSCHGADGQGLPMNDGTGRTYPPLWGEKSYNEAAGLYRISTFAGYVKGNMPFGASYNNPQLSDEEAWDVAGFVNAQPRPKHKFLNVDWPKIEKKPIDHPFGPYKDPFSEAQHKFGPYQPIADFYASLKK